MAREVQGPPPPPDAPSLVRDTHFFSFIEEGVTNVSLFPHCPCTPSPRSCTHAHPLLSASTASACLHACKSSGRPPLLRCGRSLPCGGGQGPCCRIPRILKRSQRSRFLRKKLRPRSLLADSSDFTNRASVSRGPPRVRAPVLGSGRLLHAGGGVYSFFKKKNLRMSLFFAAFELARSRRFGK